MSYFDRDVIICQCNSAEHQIIFTYIDSDDPTDFDELAVEVHLTPIHGFFQRIRHAIKYVFGYRSRFGDFDNIVVDAKDCDRMIKYFERLKKNHNDVVERNNLEQHGFSKV